jgi:hypothetical protein
LEITAYKLRARYRLYKLRGYEVLGTYFPHVSYDALGIRCHANAVSDFVERFSLTCNQTGARKHVISSMIQTQNGQLLFTCCKNTFL